MKKPTNILFKIVGDIEQPKRLEPKVTRHLNFSKLIQISKHLQKERNILSEHSMLNIPDELKNIEMMHVYKKKNIRKKLNHNLVRVLLI